MFSWKQISEIHTLDLVRSSACLVYSSSDSSSMMRFLSTESFRNLLKDVVFQILQALTSFCKKKET